LVNFYVEQVQAPSGATKAAFYPTPGVQLIDNGTAYASVNGAGRAHFAQDGTEYCVIGATFYGINSLGVLYGGHVLAGDSVLSNEPATICGNGAAGDQILVTSQTNAYIYTVSTAIFTRITALDGKATCGDYLDGYFIVLDAATSTLWISDLLDGATWDPTQFIQNSASSDNWISMKVANRYIYLMGSATTQVWYDAGTFPIPFEPHPSGEDIRARQTGWGVLTPCSGQWFFGCSFVAPVEAFLTINGFDTDCDSMGYQDCLAGLMLGAHGYRFVYDSRMVTYESEELHGQPGNVFHRWDPGVSPDDKSHKILELVQGGRTKAPNYFGPEGLRGLRQHMLNGGQFPICQIPQHEWFTRKPLSSLPENVAEPLHNPFERTMK
jgi:hypothetical protein